MGDLLMQERDWASLRNFKSLLAAHRKHNTIMVWQPEDKGLDDLDKTDRQCGTRLSIISMKKGYIGHAYYSDGRCTRCLQYTTTKGLVDLRLSREQNRELYTAVKKLEDNDFSDKELIEREKYSQLAADVYLGSRCFCDVHFSGCDSVYKRKITSSDSRIHRVEPGIVFNLQYENGRRMPFFVFMQEDPTSLQRQFDGLIEGFLQGSFEQPGLEVPQVLHIIPEEDHALWRETLSEAISKKRRYLQVHSTEYGLERVALITSEDFKEKWRVASEKEVNLRFYENNEIIPGALDDCWHDVHGFHGVTPLPQGFVTGPRAGV